MIKIMNIEKTEIKDILTRDINLETGIEGQRIFCSNEYFADGIFRHTVMRKKL